MGQPEMRKIEENWILVTYDIPRGEGSLRKRVLRKLHRLGALQFTESVYYMPYTAQGMRATREIADSGTIFVWYSRVKGEDAKILTKRFILEISSAVEDLEAKVWKAEDLLASGQPIDWRLKSLNAEYRGLVRAAELIRSEGLAERLSDVRQRLDELREMLRNSVVHDNSHM